MILRATLLVLAAVALAAPPARPCSAFLVCGEGRVLFGNNEDYLDPETRVWFVPATGERHGVMYLGFDNGFPQGGMNDAGLAFDGFATGAKPLRQQDGKRAYPGNPIVEAMETCATVEEVVAFLETVDLSPLLTRAMLFFADASGDAVIVEGDEFLRKSGDWQAITNFYQSEHEDDRAQCPRYAAAVKVIEARDAVTVDMCERALAASAQRGKVIATLYSNVFDLSARTARLYLFHDFEHVVELDLAAELAKGARTLVLPDLFEENTAFEAYVEYQTKSLEQRTAERRGPAPPAEVLEGWAGRYDLTYTGASYRVDVARDGDGLSAYSPLFANDTHTIELLAASDDEFFAMRPTGELVFRFRRDDAGRATGFTLLVSGVPHDAVRVRPVSGTD